jgi:acetate---CoA ligase (ADP-forming)
MQIRDDIDRLLHPQGVAVVGSIGIAGPNIDRGAPPEQWLQSQRALWGDSFYLVNPSGGHVGTVPIYRRIADVPDPVELAVITIGRDRVAAAAEECGRRGIRYLLVQTIGFREAGPEGAALEDELLEIVRRHGMRLLGPNTTTSSFLPMAAPQNPRIRKIGLVTQSGHMGQAIVQAAPYGVAFSRWVPTGNEADLEAADFIEYFAYDRETAVIAAYLEGFRDGAKIRRALAAARTQNKPVVAIKVGASTIARQIASSHTAHLAGSDSAAKGLFKQFGVIRVGDVDELIETAALHAKLPPMKGSGVALYSMSGGSSALMADQAESFGVSIPTLTQQTQARLHELIPSYLAVSNPIDNGGSLPGTGTLQQRRLAFEIICEDPSIDLLVVGLSGVVPNTGRMASDVVDFVAVSEKPVAVVWNTWKMDVPEFAALVESGVPLFRSFRSCFQAVAGLVEFNRRLMSGSRPAYSPTAPVGTSASPRRVLDFVESATLLDNYGVRVPKARIVRSFEEAREAAIEIGYPVVLKAFLPDVVHKSDAGLVRTGLAKASELQIAFRQMAARVEELAPGSSGTSLQVQGQASAGTEMIIGVIQDPTLGPVILVGLGGIFTEVLNDVSVRPLPITVTDANEMIGELQGYPLLAGFRGISRVDVEALVEALMSVAHLAEDPNNHIRELDINPIIVSSDGAIAVDSLVVVSG